MAEFSVLLKYGFVLSCVILMAACVIAANRMDSGTCGCMKASMVMVIIGAAVQMIMACNGAVSMWCMLPGIPIGLGISIRLIFDRRAVCTWGN